MIFRSDEISTNNFSDSKLAYLLTVLAISWIQPSHSTKMCQFSIHMLFPENMENCANETQHTAFQIKNQELAHLCLPSLD